MPETVVETDISADVDVFELASIAMVITDRAGRFCRVNPAFGRLLGRCPADLVGSSFSALTSPDDIGRSQAAAMRDLTAQAVDPARFEKRYVRPDGSCVPTDLMHPPAADRRFGALGALPSEVISRSDPVAVWLVRGTASTTYQVCHRGETHLPTVLEHAMFMIGFDPHKGSHTAAAVDHSETVIDTLRVVADGHQRDRLLEWAVSFSPRTWAVEGATGMGALLAQQLVAAGEHVVDVPPKLSARVRLLEAGKIDKTDPNDARSAAIVAWPNPLLNVVVGLDDHRVVLRMLADRDHQITARCRTRAAQVSARMRRSGALPPQLHLTL